MGVIRYKGFYSVGLCRAHPTTVFVFGDNTKGFGKGGQAIIRDEPNALGVPTKRFPSMAPRAFFRDGEDDALIAVLDGLKAVWERLRAGEQVVIPVTEHGEVSLGLGLAKLNELAPNLYQTIVMHVGEMCTAYGEEPDGQFPAAD